MIFCYSTDDRSLTEEVYVPAGKRPPRCLRRDGKLLRRDIAAEHKTAPPPGNWPRWSMSLGVNPKQIAQAKRVMESNGVPAEFDKRGFMKINSPGHEKAACKVMGFANYDRYT